MGITSAIESLYNCCVKSFQENKKELPAIMKVINKLPVIYFMFIIATSIDTQLRLVHPSLMNKFVLKLVTISTNGRGDEVGKRILDEILGFK
jgi:hypothetical protein